ncbi:MAG: gephyrin-like molybdotransferase receptor GlpR [Mycobacterium sp.]
MPSIPQSLLWISLVVLWLFVLVPMLTNRRDRVRRTSDVALSTRVLNGASRLVRRRGPAVGHRHDPDWQRSEDDVEFEEFAEPSTRAVAALAAPAEHDYLDVDVIEEVTDEVTEEVTEEIVIEEVVIEEVVIEEVIKEEVVEAAGEGVEDGIQESLFDSGRGQADPSPDDQDAPGDVYEYVEDTSGLEAEDEPADDEPVLVPRGSRERRFDSSAAVAVSARKYRFRMRMLIAMSVVMVATAVLAFTVSDRLWWTCGAVAAVTVLYLAYLRRQTRIEAQVRRRRQQRMERLRAAAEYAADWRGFEDTGRFHRPGAAVLEIDDEDPIFEHLDEMPYSRHYDLPRAAGQ